MKEAAHTRPEQLQPCAAAAPVMADGDLYVGT